MLWSVPLDGFYDASKWPSSVSVVGLKTGFELRGCRPSKQMPSAAYSFVLRAPQHVLRRLWTSWKATLRRHIEDAKLSSESPASATAAIAAQAMIISSQGRRVMVPVAARASKSA